MIKLNCPFIIIPTFWKIMKPTEYVLFSEMWSQWNYYKDEEGWYCISLKKLSLTSGLSVSAVQSAIKGLVKKNILEKKQSNKLKAITYYKFNISEIEKITNDMKKKNNAEKKYSEKKQYPNAEKKQHINIEEENKINKKYIGYSKDINDCSCIVTEDKEKIKNKKESCNEDSLQSGTTEDNTIKVFNNSSSGDGDKSSVIERGFDKFKSFYDILEDGDEDSPLAETPEEVKKLYGELTSSGKVDSPAVEDNTKTDFSNIPSGDGESTQSSTVGNEDITSSGMEEENNPQSESSNNCAGRTLTPQVEEETTLNEKTQENAPQTSKNASFEKMTPQAAGNKHQNIKNNAPEKPQNEQKDAAANSTLVEKIHKLRENMEMGKDLLYEACKMKSLSLWRERAEWTKLQLNNLKKLDIVAWEKERSSFKSWSDKTKHCFPEGWDKKEEPQPKEYETEIRPVDIQIFKYWKEKGDSEAVNTLIGRFLDKYGAVTVDNFLSNWSGAVSVEDKKKVEKVVEKTPLQTWAETWFKLQNKIESANVDSEEYDKLLDEGIELFKVFPKDEGDWSRQQDTIRYFISYQAEHGRPTDKIYNKWILNNTDDEKKTIDQN